MTVAKCQQTGNQFQYSFTVLVVGAALLFTLWLGKSDADRQFEIYDIVFQEAVSGLSKGGTVEFNGIKIGDVVSLRLDPDDAHRVIARVRVDSSAPVRSDTRARLVPAGITGLAMIRLTSGDDPASRHLVSERDEVARIVAAPSPLTRLLADGEDAVTNVNDLLVQARELFSAANVASIGRTLCNLEQATDALAAHREDLNTPLRQVTPDEHPQWSTRPAHQPRRVSHGDTHHTGVVCLRRESGGVPRRRQDRRDPPRLPDAGGGRLPGGGSPLIMGKKLNDPNYTYDETMNVFFAGSVADGDRCIKVRVSDPDSESIQDNFQERVRIKAIALNFKKDLSSILPAVTDATLISGSTVEYTICFPQCPYLFGGTPEIGIVAMDDACSLPLSDTLKVLVDVAAPPNNQPRFTSPHPVNATLNEGDQQAWPWNAVDDDGDPLIVSVLTNGFSLAGAGMQFLTTNLVPRAPPTAKWNP